MDKLDKLKLASSSFGERLMTGGVQMSRLVGTKMKEILQAPTPESKIVDEATLETMEEPNWGLNLRICGMINNEEFNGTEIVKAIKKKIGSSKNVISQRLSLDLLETCTSNCDKVFSEVASEKVLDDMVGMIQDDRTDERNRRKAVQLIRSWGESEELMYLPVFRQTHLNLKTNRIPAGPQGGNSSPLYETMESLVYQQPLSPRPLPDMDLMGIEDDISPYGYGGQSVEQKKELLVVSRNSLDLLSSILDSGMEPIPINDELTVSMLEKCKESLPLVQRIAETTTDDDILLFEALNLHDELEQLISRCAEIKSTVGSDTLKIHDVKSTDTIQSPENGTINAGGSGPIEVKAGSGSVVNQKDENLEQKQSV
ncbi:TOM1-like protein 2 [Cynara cardunculus var. scolymus]|uniref:TOM1-like protein 2 n=1 Tax=Cynara cardunculus var. scolymus TaxID=59895 RepID=UPI000D62717F|nr:TOM1-like protein 2 [Cynara cardunculus var. scolymus]